MSSDPHSDNKEERPFWLFGATQGGEDLAPAFIKEGIAQCFDGPGETAIHDKMLSIQVGDKVAIKASYPQKYNLPFIDYGFVSRMDIKATGTVIENPGDGTTVKVQWDNRDDGTPRPWFYSTYRQRLHEIKPSEDWIKRALADFCFKEGPQDYTRFFYERSNWNWIKVYHDIALALRGWRSRRTELLANLRRAAKENKVNLDFLASAFQTDADHIPDLCPFTVMALFNRPIDKGTRGIFYHVVTQALGVTLPDVTIANAPALDEPPSVFGTTPEQIEALWTLFDAALDYAQNIKNDEEKNYRTAFLNAYDQALAMTKLRWGITYGLCWIAPEVYPLLNQATRRYLARELHIAIALSNKTQDMANGSDYLTVRETLLQHIEKQTAPQLRDFIDLIFATKTQPDETPRQDPEAVDEESTSDEAEQSLEAIATYGVKDIVDNGAFLDEAQINEIIDALERKKNLILQGAPGTGKTWFARRLAYAIVGEDQSSRVHAMQFHPNLAYEDFIRGWRASSGAGGLVLQDGPFLELIHAAHNDPQKKFVFVIEEINRANLSRVFGEMFTLLEADKRSEENALQLTYHRKEDPLTYLPPNFYVIGTMNTADRSIAMVDIALRRRFAFTTLEPYFGNKWEDCVLEAASKDSDPKAKIQQVRQCITQLNELIAKDTTLGAGYQIGHSYFTPAKGEHIPDIRVWFNTIVKTEIQPLLAEYWYDDENALQEALSRLEWK